MGFGGSSLPGRRPGQAGFRAAGGGLSALAPVGFVSPAAVLPAILLSQVAPGGGRARSVRREEPYEVWKRAVDVTAAAFLLLLTLPLFAVLALLVKLSSPGPVFFAHRRLGRAGTGFYCLKFRTMVANAEEVLRKDPELRARFEQEFKLDEDPRITRVGAFLRKTSLDELPQLLNVLRGEMSLIGPRPVVGEELPKYGIYSQQLLSVRPGLSGLWQALGRSDTTYDERVILDMLYVDHRSLWLDLWLLWLTVAAVFRGKGAR